MRAVPMRHERPRRMTARYRRVVLMRFGHPNLAWRGIAIAAILLLLPVAGCETGEGSDKRSHHDVDHTTPDHWPDDLADLALKITRRIGTLREGSGGDETVGRELSDLVSWTPEVAADSDLTESEWIPLDQASEALSRRLKSDRGRWTEANLDRASGLAERIAEASRRFVGVDVPPDGNLDGAATSPEIMSPATRVETARGRAGDAGDQAGEGASEIGSAGGENDG